MNKREATKRYALTGYADTTHTCPACAMLQPNHILSAHVHQAGFTIVEVMVAVVVFSVGLLAIAGMQTQSISQSTLSDQMSMRINAITHQAETLIGVAVLADTTKNIEVNPIFEEANMCKYGEECTGGYDKYDENNKPYTMSQRVVQGYPLPNLAMVELEVIPKGVTASKAQQSTVRISFVRSLRWN